MTKQPNSLIPHIFIQRANEQRERESTKTLLNQLTAATSSAERLISNAPRPRIIRDVALPIWQKVRRGLRESIDGAGGVFNTVIAAAARR